ncbi:hypothetical protein [Frankia sp. QA3]|uniref:hypothetical protein n=1 Tax=Frankia sp. QA3 TaxID=710111 RepID=UPI000269C1C8|nr:hypothetical protein [Frankia sp. QA3]EIV93017.1 hypothetical protein FraQA3DRAFT_2692 [Frankia sp. QA3]
MEAAIAQAPPPVGLPSLSWVWAPFAAEGTPIARTMGVVARRVADASDAVPAEYPIDPRIALPCALRSAIEMPADFTRRSEIRAAAGRVDEAWNRLPRSSRRPLSRPELPLPTPPDDVDIVVALDRADHHPELDAEADDLVNALLDGLALDPRKRSLLDGLPPAVRRVALGLVLRGQSISEARWRGIFHPRRETERAVYGVGAGGVVVVFVLGGLVFAALGIVGLAPDGSGWLHDDARWLALSLAAAVVLVIVLAFYDVDLNNELLEGLICWLIGGVFAVGMCMVDGLLDLLGFGLGLGCLAVATAIGAACAGGRRWRAPANPVRDAIRDSRIVLGAEASVLGSYRLPT